MENSRVSRRKKRSDFIVQGGILAIAGIVVRLIGMLYRIPLANIIGNEGNGYYSAAFSVYSILLIVSSYSLPVAVSKMIAARIAKNEYRNSVKILKAALFYATIVGAIGAAILWFGADFFANEFLNMPFTSYALKALAPTIWVMAYLGVLRGYFQGVGTMIPTAISQIFEQIINAIISLGAAAVLFRYGIAAERVHETLGYSFAFGAAGGTIGTGIGALAAFLLLGFLLLSYRPLMRRQQRRDKTRSRESYGKISYILCITILPIIISSTLYNISSVIDNGIYGNAMKVLGNEAEIASTWGIYMGKYHLLFNIPVAIASALASSLIPSLSEAVANRNKGQILDRVSTAIRFAMLVAIPAAAGLAVLSGPINNMLFYNGNNDMLIRMTITGSIAVVFFSLSTVTNAVLQGINRMRIPIYNALISLVLHVIALLIMLFGFHLGIYSVVYANILFALFMCILNGISIGRHLDYRQEFKKTFLLPAIAAGIMGAAAYGVYRLVFQLSHNNLMGTLTAVFASLVVYAVLLLKLKCVDEVELYAMPGGVDTVRLARKLHLL